MLVGINWYEINMKKNVGINWFENKSTNLFAEAVKPLQNLGLIVHQILLPPQGWAQSSQDIQQKAPNPTIPQGKEKAGTEIFYYKGNLRAESSKKVHASATTWSIPLRPA